MRSARAHPDAHPRGRGQQVVVVLGPGVGAGQPGQHGALGGAVAAGCDGDGDGGGVQQRAGGGSDDDLPDPAVGRRSEDEQVAGMLLAGLGQRGGHGPALRPVERGLDVRPLGGEVGARLVEGLFAGLVGPRDELGVHLGQGRCRPMLRDDRHHREVFLQPGAGQLRGQVQGRPGHPSRGGTRRRSSWSTARAWFRCPGCDAVRRRHCDARHADSSPRRSRHRRRSSRCRDEHRWRRIKHVDHGPSRGCHCSAPPRPPETVAGSRERHARNSTAARAPRGNQRVRRAAVVRAGSACGSRCVDQMVAALPPAAASLSMADAGERVGRDLQRDAVEVPVTEDLDRLAGADRAGLHQLVDADGAALRGTAWPADRR